MTTKAIPNSDPKKDLRVVWSGDGKYIVADYRNRPQGYQNQPPTSSTPQSLPQQQKPSSVPKPFRRQIVKGSKR